jgi:hypothetical protein
MQHGAEAFGLADQHKRQGRQRPVAILRQERFHIGWMVKKAGHFADVFADLYQS